MDLGQTTPLSIDLEGALRRRKPEKHRGQLEPRSRTAFFEWTSLGDAGPVALVLDTNV